MQAFEVMSSLRWTVRWHGIYGFKCCKIRLLLIVTPYLVNMNYLKKLHERMSFEDFRAEYI